ncbi:MAG: RraA family protein [Terriglobia bacterium]|jgi:regulator of RNase E activity RraA
MNNDNHRIVRAPATSEDVAQFEKIERQLYTAVVSDSLDELGYRDQAMSHSIRPLFPEVCLAGWARTVMCVDVDEIPDDPYAMEIEAVDSILAGEVAVISTGGSVQNSPWGELLSTAAMARGARGAVVDGLVRDVKKIEKLGFSVFATGIKPVDSKGRGVVVNYNIPVSCGGVNVFPGDLIVGDFDGVVAVPAALVPEVLERAVQKVSSENHSREDLLRGAFLRDVYEKYGVL